VTPIQCCSLGTYVSHVILICLRERDGFATWSVRPWKFSAIFLVLISNRLECLLLSSCRQGRITSPTRATRQPETCTGLHGIPISTVRLKNAPRFSVYAVLRMGGFMLARSPLLGFSTKSQHAKYTEPYARPWLPVHHHTLSFVLHLTHPPDQSIGSIAWKTPRPSVAASCEYYASETVILARNALPTRQGRMRQARQLWLHSEF